MSDIVEKDKGGRPTVYGDKIIEKAKHYIKHYNEFNDVMPSVAGLSVVLGVARSTVYKWCEEEGKEKFSDIIRKLEAEQERKLLNMGLSGDFNSTITKLCLTKHGYSDKVDTTVKDVTPKIIKDDIE